jgi:hypothetical protein
MEVQNADTYPLHYVIRPFSAGCAYAPHLVI